MKDIIERLREKADEVRAARIANSENLAELLEEGAHEIDELRSLNEAMKA